MDPNNKKPSFIGYTLYPKSRWIGLIEKWVFSGFLVLWTSFLSAQNLHPIPLKTHSFTVVAHRGDHTLFPENSLKAFEQAIMDGADYVEIDLRTSLDSILVIMHDDTVNRMTDGNGKVKDLPYSILKNLKIKDKTRTNTLEYPIPKFDEVLALCQNKIHIYLDFKNADVGQTYREIKKWGMEKQILVYINAYSQFQDWKRIAPEMPLMISLPGNIKNSEQLKSFLDKNKLAFLDGDYSDYEPEMVSLARQYGTLVWPDIQGVKESENWEKAIKIGFDGLQTDHPSQLIQYLEKKGIR